MNRFLLIFAVFLFLASISETPAVAQQKPAAEKEADKPDPWPPYPLNDDFRKNAHSPSGGYYFSLFKIAFCWGLFLCWVRTTDWISQDAQIMRTNWQMFNPIAVAAFAAAFLLVWVLPGFWFGLLLMILAYVGPLMAYIIHRNSKVEKHERVLTPDHLRHYFADKLRPLGIKIETEKVDVRETGPDVVLTALGAASAQENDANLLSARQLPGYLGTRELMFDVFSHRAEAVLLDYAEQGVAVRYLIDGIWHNNQPQPREAADPVLEVLKTIAGLNPQERAAKQVSGFGASMADNEFLCHLTSQGTKTGERVLLKFETTGQHFAKLEDLGLRQKMAESLTELVGTDHGMVLFSALPSGGLTTTFHTLLSNLDRFMREFVSIEEEAHPEPEIQNVEVTTYSAAGGETPATILPKLIRTQPNVVVCRNLEDVETVRLLCQAAKFGADGALWNCRGRTPPRRSCGC